jgi:hypothetical protein
MTIPPEYQKAGYRTIYGDDEAKLAIAQKEIVGSGGGGSGGGDASADNQTIEITKLTSIDTKFPIQGQALPAASIPVVLPAAQITSLTPLSSISVSNFPSTQNVTFSNSSIQVSSLPALATGANAIGSITNTSFASTQSGTWNVNNISGTISLPTLAATSTLQATGNTSLGSIDTKIPTSINSRLPITSIADSLIVTGSANSLNGDVIASTDISNYSSLILQLTGIWVATVYIQFSNDNSNWQTGTASQIGLGATTPFLITGNGIYCFPRQGKYFRARLISYISGTTSGTLFLSNDTAEHIKTVAPISVASQQQTFYDSVTAKLPSAVSGDRIKANTVGATLDLSGSASAINTDVIASTDISDYSWVCFQLTGTWVANIQVQFSYDNVNFQACYFYNTSGVTILNLSTAAIYAVPKQGKYFKLRIVSYTSGTVVATGQATNNAPAILPIQTVAFNTAQNVTLTSAVVDTELPAAISLGDTIAPSSSPTIGNITYAYNTTTSLYTRIKSSNNGLFIDGSNFTQSISASSLPLPTLAATSTLQTTGNTSLSTIQQRLMPAGSSSTLYISMGTAVSGNLKASAGNVYALDCINVSTGLRFLQLFDSTAAPTAGAVPKIPPFPIPANNGLLLVGQDVLGGEGINFTTGISFGISTTALTYTAATATDVAVSIRYA